MIDKPFVYIASLKRTGSTVLCEALTSFPELFIFIEPKLAIGRFAFKQSAIDLFLKHGIDLAQYKDIDKRIKPWQRRLYRRGLGKLAGANNAIEIFRKEIVPQLDGIVSQVGVKEIWHTGWQRYLKYFDDIRVVLTARDPRDLFISEYYRVQSGKETYRNGFSVSELARQLNREFKHQKQMYDCTQCLQVRYEDMCRDDSIIQTVREFVGSQDSIPGEIGGYLKNNNARQSEFKLHGGKITNKSVGRWENLEDPEIARETYRFFDAMAEYAEFWGYSKD